MSQVCYYCEGKGYKNVSYWSMLKGEMSPVRRETCAPCLGRGILPDSYQNWAELSGKRYYWSDGRFIEEVEDDDER